MKKIKKNDDVIVISGKYKGVIGLVEQVLGNDRVIVSGVAIQKKSTKPNAQKNIVGGIVMQNGSIHISNIAILNPNTQKGDKVGIKIENGLKKRFFKSNGKEIVEKV